MSLRVAGIVPKPAHGWIHGFLTEQEKKNATGYSVFNIRFDPFFGRRSQFERAGKAGANAHRWLSVWQLSVQHSEGREPSRLRTKVKGN